MKSGFVLSGRVITLSSGRRLRHPGKLDRLYESRRERWDRLLFG